jgi:TetR/AcrR family transcriptional regulator, regulator of cefoperazone and chloramphenicol sensitivity
MRSRPHDPARSADDLTARARIRDAAVERFGTAGYSGTSIRDVAGLAGVSAGLVQHHFGSKEGLRAACDAHVVEQLRVLTARKLERSEYDASFVGSMYDATRPVVRYIARGLTEGWPGVAAIFEQAAGDTEAWLTATWPDRYPAGSAVVRLHAGVLASMSLGTLVLHAHLARWSGVDPLEPGQQHISGAATIEVMLRMAEFMETSTGRSMRSALAEYERMVSGSGERERDE